MKDTIHRLNPTNTYMPELHNILHRTKGTCIYDCWRSPALCIDQNTSSCNKRLMSLLSPLLLFI